MQTQISENIPNAVTFTQAERRVFKPKEKLTVSQWAERYRFVTTGSAKGLWSNDLTPYLVEPMDTWNLPYVRRIILCFAPQTGKTSVALNCLLYSIDQDPGPAMYIMPDEKAARRISNRQLIPTIRSTPRSASMMSDRMDDTSTLHVRFKNGMDLMMAWASSPAVLASESIRYLFLDEPAKYADFSGKEADPFSLAEVRMNVYPHTSKMIEFSTPNVEGDAFDRNFKNEPDETRVYHAKCPFCGELQFMRFENIHWPDTLRDHRVVLRNNLARYACVNCAMDWDDFRRDQAVKNGRWIAEKPVERPRCVAFGPLPSWYSPFVSLSKAASVFLNGRNDPDKLMAFVTQHAAEAWKEVVEQKEESKILEQRTQTPPAVVPEKVVALTAGIDVQKNGFWYVIRGWEPDLTSHLISYGQLATFNDVENLIFNLRYPKVESDETLGIWRAAMDTGGGKTNDGQWTRTEEIYQWLRSNGRNVVFGIKGASRPQLNRITVRVIDKMPRSSRVIPGGLELRLLDTVQYKDLIHWRLGRNEGESQRFLLHQETGMDYAMQLLAEEKRRNRKGKTEWVAVRKDNHLLDCEVYAAACADNEWMPSLSLLIANMRRLQEAKNDGNNAPPAVARSKFISGR